MNFWEILSIEPVRDAKSIKRAYTALLRKHSPEKDPEGFQKLRGAYEQALQWLEYSEWEESLTKMEEEHLESPKNEPPTSAPGDNPEIQPVLMPPFFLNLKPSAVPTSNSALGNLMKKIEADFHDHGKRQSTDFWKSVLDSELLWNLDAKQEFGLWLFEFIGQKNHEYRDKSSEIHIPKQAWIVIDEALGWTENEVWLYSRFPEELVESILDPIRESRGKATARDLRTSAHTGKAYRDLVKGSADEPPWQYLRLALPLALVAIYAFRQCS